MHIMHKCIETVVAIFFYKFFYSFLSYLASFPTTLMYSVSVVLGIHWRQPASLNRSTAVVNIDLILVAREKKHTIHRKLNLLLE